MPLKRGGPHAEMSFLEHLEELRWHLVRSVIAIVVLTIAVFTAKSFVFQTVIFGPRQLDFLTYRGVCKLSHMLGLGDNLCITEINYRLINIDMAGQFMLHIKVSLILGIVTAFPYIFWEFWRFIRPALHPGERKYATGIVFWSSLLFFTGVLFGYFILGPFALNFLGSYSISEEIVNTISISSYISLLVMMVLISGIVFELPVAAYLLSKIGLLTPAFMRTNRRYAIIIILILSGIITPSPDVISQIVIAIPLLFLYEVSIFISARVERGLKKAEEAT